MTEKKNSRIIQLFRALGDETRFQVMQLLLRNDLCVGALARLLDVSKPAVSQHLKILREAGLVKGEKRGYWTHYRVEKELLQEAAAFLTETAETNGREAYICLRHNKEEEASMEGRVLPMCKNCCEQPEKLKGRPQECTPEQVKECHGDEKDHPCSKEEAGEQTDDH